MNRLFIAVEGSGLSLYLIGSLTNLLNIGEVSDIGIDCSNLLTPDTQSQIAHLRTHFCVVLPYYRQQC